jgi:hypothetical protein
MPLDATGYGPSPRVLTRIEARDLAVLKAARHRIRHRWMWFKVRGGWTWASWIVARLLLGHSCASIAINRAAGWRNHQVSDSAQRRLRHQLPEGWSIGEWNDDPITTHADILVLFDRAIAELEE